MSFQVRYSPAAVDHLRAFTAADRALVIDTVDDQLTHEPHVSTRNRKPLRPNQMATWELRIGNIRVFYDVNQGDLLVEVRAVGVKVHNVLRIGGDKVDL